MNDFVTKKEAKQEQIIQAATALFREKGYVATTMKDVANRLGVGVPGLYNHIASKEAVLQKICFRMAEQFFNAMERASTVQGTYKDKMTAIIAAHLAVVTHDTAATAVFMNEWRHLSEPYLGQFIALRNAYENQFKKVLTDGIEAGEFIAVDHTLAIYTVLAAVNGARMWYNADGKLTPNEIATQISAVVLNGLCSNKR